MKRNIVGVECDQCECFLYRTAETEDDAIAFKAMALRMGWRLSGFPNERLLCPSCSSCEVQL